MKWTSRHRKAGDKRFRTKCLWWPVRIGDEVRWLERARWEEVFSERSGWNRFRWAGSWDEELDREEQETERFLQTRAFLNIDQDLEQAFTALVEPKT